ncbi:discoidin domain-containing protein [Nocardia sp. NPDC050793]|uniref:discoidin domain-containing protein n=1 Tax=Nocardia sp. NPDC050793 TaxID=3155159 RepID=UPI0033D499A1
MSAPASSHPFVGNGYLGLRVPPHGIGYTATGEKTGWPLYTPAFDGAFVAGLYSHTPAVADDREVVAAIPNWSGLTVRIGASEYTPDTPAAQISRFRQTLDWRCGVVRTKLTWTIEEGKSVDLDYAVLADRSDQHVGAVRLTVVPRWSGELVLTDVLDGAGARRITATDAGASDQDSIHVGFRTEGTGVTGAVTSVLRLPSDQAQRTEDRTVTANGLTARQEFRLQVRAGETYEVTKFVGVDTAHTAPDPAAAASAAARRASERGWSTVLADSAAAWRALWRGDIAVPGRSDVQSWVRGALYALYASTNPQQDNSISPVGLSSDNYAGAIFWDADLWMFPALVQLAPDLAKSIVEYRFRTLPAAQANAQRLGYRGAFYPWTSTSRGDLAECHSWNPPHCLTQIHLQGDISLAAWQYYLATGDQGYLRERIWPIMKSLAEFWTARVTSNPDGSYSIDNVAGPDEYSNGVRDAVYTNAVAALALRNASEAAQVLGTTPPPEWTGIADRLRMPFDQQRQVFLQYDGYQSTPIKQADTVLLLYPLEWPMPQSVSTRLLEYYAQRTDPDGPAMTDSVHAIGAAGIGMPGCVTHTFIDRAARPFVRAPFGQFAEARGEKAGAHDPLAGAPAFTFVTAAGGFLQSFTNGLLGLRLRQDEVVVDPILPPELSSGITVTGMHWQGRTFDAQIGPDETTIVLTDGAPMPVRTSSSVRTIEVDQKLTINTRRPDLSATENLARCKPVTTSSAESGKYGDAAVDGSPATGWTPASSDATLTIDLGASTDIEQIVPRWAGPEQPAYTISVSSDTEHWTPVAVEPPGRPGRAQFVRIRLSGAALGAMPSLSELEILGSRK